MVFSSPTFLFYFLPFFLLAYFCSPHRWKNSILLSASLIFYAWGEPYYVILLGTAIVFNTLIARRIGKSEKPNTWLTIGVCANLMILVAFKYLALITETLSAFLTIGIVNPALPLGVSFFVFQSISFLIDVSRKHAPANIGIVAAGTYIAMFPQLIAGPIVRFGQILPDLIEKKLSLNNAVKGARLFVVGLAMKVLVADSFAPAVDKVFSLDVDNVSTASAWLGALGYTFQIYFDFCGYSYMAIGVGLVCGLHLPTNFNYPYASRSVTEFWRRWHISLSTWFRDYLYIPLGGNRRGKLRTYINLILVFLLCGLWHGAAWSFLVWGAYHGLFLIVERTFVGAAIWRLPRLLQHFYLLLVVLVGWVLFRSPSIEYASAYLKVLFDFRSVPFQTSYIFSGLTTFFAFASLASMPIVPVLKKSLRLWRHNFPTLWTIAELSAVLLVFLATIAAISASTYQPFIYFRF